MRAWTHGTNAAPHRFVSDFDQPPCLNRRLADEEHAARVAVVTVFDHGHVDVDDIAVLQLLVAGNAVADDVIDRRAKRCGVGRVSRRRIVERCRNRALFVDHVVVRERIDFARRRARLDVGCQVVEELRAQATGFAHARDVFGRFEGDRHRF